MRYFKVVSSGLIVDASTENEMVFVRWQERNRQWLRCAEHVADGLVASDGSAVYLLHEMTGMDGFRLVTYEEIDQATFEELREEIDAGRTVPEPEEEEEPDSPGKTRLTLLEEQVAALLEANEMLIGCVLEMSEIIYG